MYLENKVRILYRREKNHRDAIKKCAVSNHENTFEEEILKDITSLT